jgi:hypothetical protein
MQGQSHGPVVPFAGTAPYLVTPRFSTEADMPTPHLNGKHETTLRTIFQHPVSHNLDWHQLVRLLSALGTVEEHDDGRLTARVNDQEAVLHRPRHKDLNSVEDVMHVRHFLERAGVTPPPS